LSRYCIISSEGFCSVIVIIALLTPNFGECDYHRHL